MSLFDKSNMVSPYAIHQQQMAVLSHQQTILIAAAKSNSANPSLSAGATHLNANPIVFPTESFANLTFQVPGAPLSELQHAHNLNQTGSIKHAHLTGNNGSLSMSSILSLGSAEPSTEKPKGGTGSFSASPSCSTTPNQSLTLRTSLRTSSISLDK